MSIMKWFRFNKSYNFYKKCSVTSLPPGYTLSFFIDDFFPDNNETERQKCSQTTTISPLSTSDRTVIALTP